MFERLFIWIITLCITPSVFGQLLHFKHLDVQEGLPSNRVYSLHEDSLGLLWIATEKGLAMFDGRKFTKYSTEAGLPTNIFYDFLDSPTGGFFALGENGQIVHFKENGFKIIPKHDSIPDSQGGYFTHVNMIGRSARARFINNLYEIREDSVVLMRGIQDQYMSNAICFCSVESDSEHPWQLHISRDRKMVIALSTDSNLILTPSFNEAIGMDKCPIWLRGKTWLFFRKKILYLMDFKSGEIKKLQSFASRIECLQVDRNGSAWVGTLGDGLWYSPDLEHWVRRSDPLLNITDIEFDHTNGLWISTLRSGLYYCPLTTLETVFSGQYEQIYVAKGKLAVATGNSFMWYSLSNRAKLYDYTVDVVAISICFDPFSNQWLLGGNNGLVVEMDTTFTYTRHHHYNSNQYFRNFSVSDSFTIASLGIGGLIHDKRKEFGLSHVNFFGEERFSDIALGRGSNLFFSSSSGTYRYKIDSKETIKFSQNKSREILRTANGNIVLGTDKAGIKIFDPELKILQQIDKSDGLSSNQVFAIAEYDSSLFVIHANGLSIVRTSSNNFEVLNYPELSAIISDLSYVSIWNDYVILGNQLEVVKFPITFLDRRKKQKFNIHLYVRSDSTHNIRAGEQIPYDNQGIEANINYASYESRKGYPLRYRTQFNDPWTEFQEKFTINNIPAGRHLMQIQFLNHAGKWVPIGDNIAFEVMSPYWKQGWFILMAGVTGVALIILGARQFYVYKLIRVEADLELKNKLREQQLRALKAQLNPHFIFNVMTSAHYYLSKNDVFKARNFLLRFSRLVRRILEHSDRSYVTLEQEIALLRDYVSIEGERIGGESISFKSTLEDEKLKQAQITPSILQPFIENSVWHGLRFKEGKRQITMHIKTEQNEIIISIEDNGIGRQEAQRRNGKKQQKSFGMRLSSERITLLAIDSADKKIKVRDLKDPSGTIVEIKLPLIFQTATQ